MLPEAYSLVREASKRINNERHFDVQLIGGIVFNQNKIAEMKTGEGKTLTIALAAYLNSLEKKVFMLLLLMIILLRETLKIWVKFIIS